MCVVDHLGLQPPRVTPWYHPSMIGGSTDWPARPDGTTLRGAKVRVTRDRHANLVAAVGALKRQVRRAIAVSSPAPFRWETRRATQRSRSRCGIEVVSQTGVHQFARSTIGAAEVNSPKCHFGVHARLSCVLPSLPQ